MALSRRNLLQLSVAASGALFLAGCGDDEPSGGGATGPFKIAGNTTPDFTQVPWLLAQEAGYFEEAQLEPEWVPMSGGVMPSALLSGSIDYAILSAGANITSLRGQGKDVKAFGTLSHRNSNTLAASKAFVAKAGVALDAPLEDRLRALKGARFAGISAASATTSTIVFLMDQVGLKRDADYTITYIDSVAGFVSAMQTGQIDAYIANSPGPQQSVANGSGVVFLNLAKDQLPPFEDMTWAVLWAMQHQLAENPERAQAVVTVVAKALTFIQDDPDGAKEAVKPAFSHLDPAVFDLAWADSLALYPPDPKVVPESFARSLRLFEGRAGVPTAEDLTAAAPYFDNTYAEAAIAAG